MLTLPEKTVRASLYCRPPPFSQCAIFKLKSTEVPWKSSDAGTFTRFMQALARK